MHNKKKLIVIAGPTAVGKTAAAIHVAKHFGTEIISADSRQCYCEMSIGTAKPDAAELAAVHHYFINSHSITEELNAGDYEQLALGYCDAVFSKSDYAVVCGGTGLYIKALCEGIDEMPKTDRAIEKALQDGYDENGMEWLQNIVAKEDPEFYAAAEQQNPARLIRGIAFRRSTGISIVHFRSGNQKERYFDIIKIGLDLPREILYDRINRRVDIMMAQGLWEEAVALYPQRALKNLQTVGYTEIFECFDGVITQEKSIELIKQHSRNYAKRQLTWFRKDKDFKWFEPTDLKGILSAVERS
ncbi:tRNA (adenosine(37)-N6)-dimethylallyltransferase MiaA [Taibaiella lutea]|uniref:tRNA dimethylallyltransferase n=1 Tax=Taibaiella lutea TaxID=2608001 RepID=A0A5M6CPY5_9BACT|nr:tRNA (adenosine(37)-N6)-dimethylallyltransferase MiaA [Taibaiella lutea]KAA5537368.1 tRNA (adenosine(37)-N6)-dimethylallyltransferase MiaA [Taibaiella lutea]